MRPSEAPPRETILVLALAGLIAGISLRCVEPMLPKLAADFGTSVPVASAAVTSFGLAFAAAVLLQGALGDRFGKLRVVTFAMGLTGLACAACAFAWSVVSLSALRFVTGAFASSAVALGMAYIGDTVPLERRQETVAGFISGSLFGQMLGPLYGGVFTDWAGWRLSFAVLGVLFLGVSAVLYVRTRPAWGAAATGAFRPLGVFLGLLRRRPVRWMIAIGVAETFFFFGPYVFLGAYLKMRFDLSYTAIGVLLAGYGAGGLLYTAAFRPLYRRLGERGLMAGGALLGATLFAAAVAVPHWAWFVPCTVGLGLAFYMIHNTVQTKATEVAPDARGAAVALYASAWSTGQATGVAAMGAAVALASYAPAIAAFGAGFGLLGWWLRTNLHRLKP